MSEEETLLFAEQNSKDSFLHDLVFEDLYDIQFLLHSLSELAVLLTPGFFASPEVELWNFFSFFNLIDGIFLEIFSFKIGLGKFAICLCFLIIFLKDFADNERLIVEEPDIVDH